MIFSIFLFFSKKNHDFYHPCTQYSALSVSGRSVIRHLFSRLDAVQTLLDRRILDSMHCGQMVLRKISKIVVTSPNVRF